MTPLDLDLEAKRRGLELRAVRNKLAVIPGDRCPSDFADVLRQHKDALIDWLKCGPCPGWQAVPPNDLPLHPVQPHAAVTEAPQVMDFIMRQIGDRPGSLCEWCLRRETAYWDAFHWPD